MPISSLVLSLHANGRKDSLARTCERLRREVPGLELGLAQGVCVPAVLEAGAYEQHDEGLRRLRDDEDVAFVDVVLHDFSDVSEFGRRPRRRRRH